MVKVSFTNSNGNVAVKVRDNLRKQVLPKLMKAINDNFDNKAVINDKGGISVPIAIDSYDGGEIYVNVEMTVSKKLPVKAKSKAKKKVAEDVEVPNLFEIEEEEEIKVEEVGE